MNQNLVDTKRQIRESGENPQAQSSASGAFFWLSAFYVVYCARPEDWIPGLAYIPLAKISSILAFVGLLASVGRTQRRFKDLPRESFYLLGMIGVLMVSAVLSPVWRGGAITHTLDFAKVYIVWVLTFLLVTNFKRLRRIIYIQTASVLVISAVSVIKGHSRPRLEGVIGGIYSNPNDLAFAVVLTLPYCLAFLLTSKRVLARLCWVAGILVMALTLFMTASRGGFITLVISGAVCLWLFGVKAGVVDRGRGTYRGAADGGGGRASDETYGRDLRRGGHAGGSQGLRILRATELFDEARPRRHRALSYSRFGSEKLPDLLRCVAGRAHDLPANRGGRRNSKSDFVSGTIWAWVQQSEEATPQEGPR